MWNLCCMCIFRKSVEKIRVSLISDKNNGCLHECKYTFIITSRSVLRRVKNVSDGSRRKNQNTHFMFN